MTNGPAYFAPASGMNKKLLTAFNSGVAIKNSMKIVKVIFREFIFSKITIIRL